MPDAHFKFGLFSEHRRTKWQSEMFYYFGAVSLGIATDYDRQSHTYVFRN